MKTLILNFLSVLLLTSCLPDTIEKWEMDDKQRLSGCITIEVQGRKVCVDAATTDNVAAGFTYPEIEKNDNSLTLPTVVEVPGINPSFIGEPEGASLLLHIR